MGPHGPSSLAEPLPGTLRSGLLGPLNTPGSFSPWGCVLVGPSARSVPPTTLARPAPARHAVFPRRPPLAPRPKAAPWHPPLATHVHGPGYVPLWLVCGRDKAAPEPSVASGTADDGRTQGPVDGRSLIRGANGPEAE